MLQHIPFALNIVSPCFQKNALVCRVSFIGRRTTNSRYAMREDVHQLIKKTIINVLFIGKGTFTLVVV